MSNENSAWNKVLTAVLKMPGIKVDRVGFLRKELRPYCNQSRLQMLGSVRPYSIVSERVIDRVAKSCINKHTALVTTASTVAGLPGGLAMAAAIPADLTQYYYHVFVLSQKLAYLYGFPDFCEDDGEMSDMASDLLTLFMGVMMGASVADEGMADLAKAVAGNAVTRLPRVAITKTALYPVVSQITRMVGMKLSKEGFVKSIGKFIPIAGGMFSGSLTLATFRPGALRLQRQLRSQKHLFSDGGIDAIEYANIKASFVKAHEAAQNPQKAKQAQIQALINMAKINDDVTPAKYKFVEQQIARAKIDGADKLDLLGNISSETSYDVDFDLLAADDTMAKETVRLMASLATTDDKLTTAERIYLSMSAQKLGIDKAELDEMLAEATPQPAQSGN